LHIAVPDARQERTVSWRLVRISKPTRRATDLGAETNAWAANGAAAPLRTAAHDMVAIAASAGEPATAVGGTSRQVSAEVHTVAATTTDRLTERILSDDRSFVASAALNWAT
jgi:hypothetical protein